MQRLSTGLSATLSALGPEAAKALKRTINKEHYAEAVRATWRSRPEIAEFVLMHTNAIYIAPDERPRKGKDKDRPLMVFGIYLDDAMARTEVDAWQFVLLQNLLLHGFTVDELRMYPAKMGMRKRKLFPELNEGELQSSNQQFSPRNSFARYEDASKQLDIFKRAACMVFEEGEYAWSVLEHVQGALVSAVPPAASVTLREGSREGADRGTSLDVRMGDQRYWLLLYVDDVEGMRRIVHVHKEALCATARHLGFPLDSIGVRPSPARLTGRHAFQRTGRSIPLLEPVY